MQARTYAGMALGAAVALAGAGWAAAEEQDSTLTRSWSGERVVVAIPAEVRYVPGPVGRVTITGPRERLAHIRIEHGVIGVQPHWGGWFWGWNNLNDWGDARRVQVVLTAPRISSAVVAGPGRLDLGRLSQDRLELTVSGPGHARASGAIHDLKVVVSGPGHATLQGLQTATMEVVVSGPGHVTADGNCTDAHLVATGPGHIDLAQLKLQDAEVRVMGPGGASIAPLRSASLSIMGPGSVRLLSHPAQVTSNVMGPGRVIRTAG